MSTDEPLADTKLLQLWWSKPQVRNAVRPNNSAGVLDGFPTLKCIGSAYNMGNFQSPIAS